MKVSNNKKCYFISKGIKYVDYRDVELLSKFTDPYGKILPRKRTGLCARYHREVTLAIKNARFMALMPYVKQ